MPRSVRSAERREAIFHPRSFGASSQTNLAPNRCDPWCSDGRNEASNRTGAGGLGGEDAGRDANEVDPGHCRRDHSGRSSGEGSGYKPPFSSSHRCRVRKREPGANDFGSSGEIVKRQTQFVCEPQGMQRTRAVGIRNAIVQLAAGPEAIRGEHALAWNVETKSRPSRPPALRRPQAPALS